VTTATAAVRFRNLGIYGQGTYAILDHLKLTAGLRFTHDETSGTGSSIVYPFLAPFSPPDLSAPHCVGGIEPSCLVHQRVTSDAPTWLLDLEYSPTEDVMAYVKYARGYRQGAVNPFGSPGFQTFLPETVEVYEVGAKTTFHGKIRGTFNAAVFYNDFSQQQLSVALLSTTQPVAPGGAIVNAGTSKMYGAEIDSTLRPFDSFRLDMAAAYLYTKLEEEKALTGDAVYNVVIPTSAVGGDLPYAPKYKASITGTYTFPLPDTVGTLELGATYTYQSSYVTITEAASPFFKADATNLVNLNLNWFRIGGGPVDASLFVTNVLDERYTAAVEGTYNYYGFESRQLGLPRMFGGRVRLRFGADAK
jgi:iron complex outermembrane receptor protein